MHVVLLVAVLAAFGLSEHAPHAPVSHPVGRLLLALGGMGVVGLFASVISAGTVRALHENFPQRQRWLREFSRWQQVHLAVWVAAVTGILYGLRWPQMVRFNWQLQRWPLIDELLILSPMVVPLLLSWASFYDVDRALQRERFALPWRKRLADRWQFVWIRARHELGLVLLPLLMMVGTLDVAEYCSPGILTRDRAWGVCAIPIVAVIIGFPLLLRRLWSTEELPDGPLRRRLESATRRWGVHIQNIYVWKTEGRLVNAAIAGVFPRLRYVFLSDGLLRRLSDEEIETVFAHEAGHARYHHTALRILAVLLPLLLWAMLGQNASPAPVAPGHIPETGAVPSSLHLMPLTGMAISVYLVVALGAYSRLLEHQADLWACRQIRQADNAGAAEINSVVSRYSATLHKLYPSGVGTGRSFQWLHPNLTSRVEFLLQTTVMPRREARFHRRLQIAGAVLAGFAVSPLILHVFGA